MSNNSEPTKKEAPESCAHGGGCCCPNQCLGAERPMRHVTSTMASREGFARSTKSAVFPDAHFTNHESLPSLPDAFSAFLDAYPPYSATRAADRIRETEYPHLKRHVCLDYTGLSLFSHAQLHSPPAEEAAPPQPPPPFFSISYKPAASLASHLQYGAQADAAGDNSNNNNSNNDIESAMRSRIMRFLNVSEDCYSMLCTANKTSAFGLLAEAYPFRTSGRLVTVYEHESEAADAMAEGARRRGAKVASAAFSWPGLRIDSAQLKRTLTKKKKRGGGLLVFPLQSGVTGARHPYFWMRLAQEHGWHVLLDACALGPKDTDTLGLSLIQPDFMVFSFFRLVGHDPSGFAALFVKNSTRAVLDAAPAVGVVSIVAPAAPECEAAEWARMEVACGGLDHADALGLVLISCRLRCLANWLVAALGRLRHPTGRALVGIYGPRVRFDRGPAVAFDVFDWRGEKVEAALVQRLADRSGISLGCGRLRAGPGIGGGVVSASLGFTTDFEDAYGLWRFVANFLDADFVEKERWRYVALNQKMVEM